MFVGIGIRAQLLSGTSPAALFTAGEVGIWYDPSDLTTMFQDSAGTTPVTAVGQPVGLRLDKSKGLVLGPELVTNGTFDTNVTGWTATASSSVVWESGAARWSTSVADFSGLRSSSFATVVGRTYEIKATVLQNTGASWRIVLVNGDGSFSSGSEGVSSAGTLTARLVATQTTSFVEIRNSTGATANRLIDNISVRELPGFHASQSIPGSRAIYASVPKGGRRNLLTYTEQFDNAAWIKAGGGVASAPTVTPNTATAPDGTLTADTIVFALNGGTTSADISQLSQAVSTLSGSSNWSVYLKTSDNSTKQLSLVSPSGVISKITVTGSWQRFEVVGSGGSIARLRLRGDDGVSDSASLHIWGAQLETGTTATAYQRVGSIYDITEAGVQTLYGLLYDGLDDFYVTPTITPGTDKVQVFAGVRKLSDAAIGILLESSAAIGANNGAIGVAAPLNASGSTFAFASRGTAFTAWSVSGAPFAAPSTVVLTGVGDIAADTQILRLNGAQIQSLTNDQGAGNYLAYPLYIGRRGGTTLPFDGYEFGLIVRFGPNLSATQIASTEAWLNTRTGAY